MSLVPEPQVNLPQFHMINPDNCVLIASMVDGIQFSGPRFLNKQLSSSRRSEPERRDNGRLPTRTEVYKETEEGWGLPVEVEGRKPGQLGETVTGSGWKLHHFSFSHSQTSEVL